MSGRTPSKFSYCSPTSIAYISDSKHLATGELPYVLISALNVFDVRQQRIESNSKNYIVCDCIYYYFVSIFLVSRLQARQSWQEIPGSWCQQALVSAAKVEVLKEIVRMIVMYLDHLGILTCMAVVEAQSKIA